MTERGREDERRHGRWALALVFASWLLLAHAAWRVGPTYDEHFYAAAGYDYWTRGDFALNREHPPLGKLLVGLPLVLAPGVSSDAHARERSNFPVWFFYQHNGADLDRNLFLARLPVTLLTALCAWILFKVAFRAFGPAGAWTALLAFAFQPTVLAQGSLAALDGTLMTLFFVAVLAFARLLEAPSWRRAAWAAVAFGLANLTKFTALLLGPCFLALALAAALARRRLAPLGWCALVFLGGLGVFAAGYLFEAKSQNEAWGSRAYVTERPVPASSRQARERLADSLVGTGAPESLARAVREAPSASAGLERVAEALSSTEALLAGDLRRRTLAGIGVLGQPGVADGALRRRAFECVLDAEHPGGGALEEPATRAGRASMLAALAAPQSAAGPDLRDWERWYEAGGKRTFEQTIFTQPLLARLVERVWGSARPVPLLSALKGLDYQLHESSLGHGSYYRGQPLLPQHFKDGNPYPEYYAVVLAIKSPLPWLALVLAGLALACLPNARRAPFSKLAFVALPLALFAFFSFGKALMGVRYVLPVFPFLALWAGRAAVSFPRAALVCAAAGALLGLRYHPHYLMYYNELAGGPRGGPRISVVSDDWGQGVRATGRFFERHRAALEQAGGLYYEPYTSAAPADFGLSGVHPVPGPVQGIVAVHALSRARDVVAGSATERRYAWLDAYEPFLVLDHSVALYDTRVPPPGGRPLDDPSGAWALE